jgi:hypothetical protein
MIFRMIDLFGKAGQCIKQASFMKALCLLALLTVVVSARETIERLDPALDTILDPQA